jgi:ribosome-associated protein
MTEEKQRMEEKLSMQDRLSSTKEEFSMEESQPADDENAKKIARLAIQALRDKKAEDIHMIDISQVSVIADYFIIAGGNNRNQIQALCDNVQEVLGRAGYIQKQTEGYNTANWILMDFGDVIVHIFDRENRLLYDLERIWRDGRQVDISEF